MQMYVVDTMILTRFMTTHRHGRSIYERHILYPPIHILRGDADVRDRLLLRRDRRAIRLAHGGIHLPGNLTVDHSGFGARRS